MGELSKLRKPTLRGQIISSFHLTLLSSGLATLLTWGVIIVIFLFFINTEKVNPANYYESQIPELLDLIHEEGDILSIENKDFLDELIPLEGLDYQVIDIDGNFLYGSMTEKYISSGEDLATHINTNIHDNGKIIQYYPVFDEGQTMNGAIGFRYNLSIISSNPQVSALIIVIGVIVFLSPFVYFYLFSYLTGKRFGRRIEKPFNEIIDGANKIRNHDLDFSLSHINSTVELNQLVFAFEEMKEALKKSLKKQWELEQERRDMVSAIAHDLKTPLTIILGHVEGLLEMNGRHPERMERYLRTIQSSSERSIQLIKELNDVSKIEKVDFTLDFTYVEIEDWIHSKMKEYDHLCRSRNITFNTLIEKNETDKVCIDLFRVNQVLDNVLTNSLHYTPENGEIKWIINIHKKSIVFEILDNGPGFSSEDTSKVFDKFYREDPSRNKSDHSGLGLFIAKTIAEKHGGKILAQNRAEGGACVKIEIKNMGEE